MFTRSLSGGFMNDEYADLPYCKFTLPSIRGLFALLLVFD